MSQESFDSSLNHEENYSVKKHPEKWSEAKSRSLKSEYRVKVSEIGPRCYVNEIFNEKFSDPEKVLLTD